MQSHALSFYELASASSLLPPILEKLMNGWPISYTGQLELIPGNYYKIIYGEKGAFAPGPRY